MTPFAAAVQAVRKLYPRMSEKRAAMVVRAVLDAVAADQGRPVLKSSGKIGEGGEATFPDPASRP